MAAKEKSSVLFVCLGNICRSPTAQAVFTKLVKDRGLSDKWLIDSAGTIDFNVGRRPDKRVINILKKKDMHLDHKARQVGVWDFTEFDYILAMDDSNLSDLEEMKPSNNTAIVKLLGSYDPAGYRVIHDPYHGDDSDFMVVYEQCLRCCEAFLNEVSK